MEEENKLYFRKNYAKYEFFKNPMVSEIPINSYRKWMSLVKFYFILCEEKYHYG